MNQVATGFAVTPQNTTVVPGSTLQLVGGTADQFGNAMTALSTVTWSVISGGGTINSAGVYTAGATPGSVVVRGTGTAGAFGNAIITITPAVALYTANASSGTTLADSSGNNKNATLTGAAAFGPGVSGNALTLTGGSALLPTSIVSGLNDFTISAWIKITTLANWARVFDFGSGTGSYMFLTPDAGGTNALRFAITTNTNSNEQQLNGPAITPGVWTHVAVTLAGNVATLYVNGIAVATNTNMTIHPTALGATTQDYLGKSQFTGDPNFTGSIDDFRIYGQALSASQILQLAAPSIVNAPAASAAPVITTHTNLSVLGNDVTAGEPALTYTWSTTGTPPAAVTFSINGSNAAKNTTATFTHAGTYNFLVTITNPGGITTTSPLTVIVTQALTTLTFTPAPTHLYAGASEQLTATALDQFGIALAAQPAFTWSLTSGSGSLTTAGVYTAPLTATAAGLQVAVGAITKSASLLTVAALLGDADLNAKVDLSDLNIVLNNLGATTTAWTSGNFDGAPTIDLTDLNDVLNHLGQSATIPALAAQPAASPSDPTSAAAPPAATATTTASPPPPTPVPTIPPTASAQPLVTSLETPIPPTLAVRPPVTAFAPAHPPISIHTYRIPQVFWRIGGRLVRAFPLWKKHF